MKRFPKAVCDAMRASGSMATCVPIQTDGAESGWETAFFMQLAGPESKLDRRNLRAPGKTFSVGFEADVIETQAAAVVIIRSQIYLRADDPLVMEVLLTPGEGGVHHEALKLLCSQQNLNWYFGDREFELIYAQSQPLDQQLRNGFSELLNQAVRHDALIRMSSHYDAQIALGEVAKNYTLRIADRRTDSRH